MKKPLLTILLVVICVLGYAQRGTVLLTGGLDYHYEKNSPGNGNDSKNSIEFIRPGIGYQISDKWILGLNLGYSRSAQGNVSNTYEIGPYVRYTKQLTDFISVYGQFETTYGQGKFSGVSNNNSSSRYIGLNALPAVEFNLGKGFGLNFNVGGLGYTVIKADGTPGSIQGFSLKLGSGFGFGLSKRFGTKK